MGNTCRSPVAAEYFNREAQERGWSVVAESAGTHVSPGSTVDVRTIKAFKGKRAFRQGGPARPISDLDLAPFDLILAMEQSQLDDLPRDVADKSFRFLDFSYDGALAGDIEDPYSDDSGQQYVVMGNKVEAAVKTLCKRLEAEGWIGK